MMHIFDLMIMSAYCMLAHLQVHIVCRHISYFPAKRYRRPAICRGSVLLLAPITGAYGGVIGSFIYQ